MKHRSLSITAGLALACLLASLGMPRAGHAGSAGAHTRLEVQNDGVSLVFSATSNHNVLATVVRVVGPDDYVFEHRAEAPLVEWVPPADLGDGRYQWEAWTVTVTPGASQIKDSAGLIERTYADEHKQVQKTFGTIIVRGGVLESIPEPFDELASAPERLFGALLTRLVPAATAADLTAGSSNPRVNFDDTQTTGTDWATQGNENDFRIFEPGVATPFLISKGTPTFTMFLSQFGRVGLGTSTPSRSGLHVAGRSSHPSIRLEDRSSAQSWWVANTNSSRFEIHSRSLYDGGCNGQCRSVPFAIAAASDGLLADLQDHAIYIDWGGRVGFGTDDPADDLHIAGNNPSVRFEADSGVIWRLFGNTTGFSVEDFNRGDTPFSVSRNAGHAALWIEPGGDVGLGTATPATALHVQRSDGSAGVLVQETNPGTSARELFKLSNNGSPFFIFENTDIAQSYSFAMGATGHFILSHQQTSGVQMRLTPAGNMTIAGSLNEGSSREIKDGITPVDSATVLAKLEALPVSEWRYKDAPGSRHVGPMAEDFHATFGLGPDERHIAPRDLAGVALAAAKALKADNDAKDRRIAALEARLARLEARVLAEE